MEKDVNEKIMYLINNLNIKDELKTKLLYFNTKLMEVKKTNCLTNIDIIIDNMPQENIDILLEYITKILEEYGLIYNNLKERIRNLLVEKD